MATCNPSTLLESAKCFQCLSKKELQAVIAQLLCNISVDGVGSSQQVYTAVYADPNVAALVPDDPTIAASFYQDPAITVFNQWNWSVSTQVWIQWSAP